MSDPTRRVTVGLATHLICALLCWSCTAPSPQRGTPSPPGPGGVFVIGGIHQHHELAKSYTYARMGQIYAHLKPDVLCVEVEQRFVDDGSYQGMPFDFAKFMVPAARRDKIPIVGIDWEAWHSKKMDSWRALQRKAYADLRLAAEVRLYGGLFEQLNAYFLQRDFVQINNPEITRLWAAKSAFKYAVLKKYPEYVPIVAFERDRNQHMLTSVLNTVRRFPRHRILVAVGIDHKYYLDGELAAGGIHVLNVHEVMARWWRG